MKKILQEKNVSPPRGCADGVPDAGPDEPRCIQVADDQHKYVDRPDAQCAAAIEVAEVARLAAGFEQDRSDEEAREHEEEVDADPSPKRRAVDKCSGEARVAVVGEDEEDGNAA